MVCWSVGWLMVGYVQIGGQGVAVNNFHERSDCKKKKKEKSIHRGMNTGKVTYPLPLFYGLTTSKWSVKAVCSQYEHLWA